MIVRLDADGAVVADADDCSTVHVETGLDADGEQAREELAAQLAELDVQATRFEEKREARRLRIESRG